MCFEERESFEVFHDCWCLGLFSRLRKVAVIFCLLVCPSVRPSERMEQLDFGWTGFQEI
jgi:hypothetical protein